jgi:DNA-binding NtrC family response regulator
LLAEHFVRTYARQLRRPPPTLSDTVLAMLCKADWPGNVRQLENVVECAVTFADGDQVRPEHLAADFIQSFAIPAPGGPKEAEPLPSGPPRPADITPLGAAVRYLERQMLTKALDASNGNKEQAANMLGIDRATLYRKLKTHHLANNG